MHSSSRLFFIDNIRNYSFGFLLVWKQNYVHFDSDFMPVLPKYKCKVLNLNLHITSSLTL